MAAGRLQAGNDEGGGIPHVVTTLLRTKLLEIYHADSKVSAADSAYSDADSASSHADSLGSDAGIPKWGALRVPACGLNNHNSCKNSKLSAEALCL